MKLLICLLIPQLVGGLGAFFTSPSIPTWYAGLKKPFFQPPAWLFGPVWTLLYLMMGLAAYLVWTRGKDLGGLYQARNIFIVQLLLNFLWSVIFFGLKNPGLAFLEIVYLWLVILLNLVVFYRINKAAGMLLIPYLGWVTFASVLNLSVFLLN